MRESNGCAPDFLILGEAKCGTTTLWEILSRHPRVFFPEEKELHYFASYRDQAGYGRYQDGGMEPYLRHFAAAGAAQLCGEATPNYLFDDGACERIAQALPRARLVAILRDPVERAWSHYWHQVRRGSERLGFEKALAAEESRLASGDPDERERYSYAARGRYVEGLRRYERNLSREQICVVFLEDLLREPGPVIERVCAHLGLRAADLPPAEELPHANKADFPRWPMLDAFTRRMRAWAEAGGAGLAGPVRALGRVTRPLRVYTGAPRMREQTRRELRLAYAPSDRDLAAWLGRPLPWAPQLDATETVSPSP